MSLTPPAYASQQRNGGAWEDIGCRNGTSHPSLDGLNYTHYCASDLRAPFQSIQIASTFQRCINSCTAHGPACFGVVWDSINHNCYPRTDPKSSATLITTNVAANLNTALVDATQDEQATTNFTTTDYACPYRNLSLQKSSTGLGFRILCGGVFKKFNGRLVGAMHVDTLDQCLEECAQSHPLCTNLVFHANLIGSGWLNCRLLTSNGGEHVTPFTRTMAHSARVVLSLPQKPPGSWSNGSIHQSNSGASFMVSANDFRDLNNTDILPSGIHHAESIESCLQSCAEKNDTCISAVYDHGLQSGYSNCYLFDDLPPPLAANDNYTFLFQQSASARFEPPPSFSSKKKSWIAGVVLGPLALCAFAATLYWYYRVRPKRKAKSS